MNVYLQVFLCIRQRTEVDLLATFSVDFGLHLVKPDQIFRLLGISLPLFETSGFEMMGFVYNFVSVILMFSLKTGACGSGIIILFLDTTQEFSIIPFIF